MNRDLANASNYAEIQNYIDVDKFIDYLLVHWYSSVSDWPENNYYGGMQDQSAPFGIEPLRYFAWDGEWSWNRQRSGPTSSGKARVPTIFKSSATVNSSSPLIAQFWHALRANNSFMDRVESRVESRVDALTASGAALSDSASLARWSTLKNYIENAVVAESARWGDALQGIDGQTRTRNDEWRTEVNEMTGFISGNAQALKNALRGEGYY